MIEYKNDKIQEKYYVEVLENGLTVYLYPKKDFYKTYAIFSTKYGSQDIEFTPIDLENSINTPEGIAHFLEHKLFENEDCNVLLEDLTKYDKNVKKHYNEYLKTNEIWNKLKSEI